MKNTTFDYIKWYLERGFDLIPLNGRAPAHSGWRTRAYTDDTLRQWDGNLGWRLGPADVVIDVDPRNGGVLSLRTLAACCPASWSLTVQVITGRGGHHYYYRKPAQCPQLRVELPDYPGVEIKTQGSQVVIPGSIHPISGKEYVFRDGYSERSIIDFPSELINLYAVPETTADEDTITPDQLAEILSQLPVEDYGDNNSWFTIMSAAVHATDGAGLAEFLEWSLSDPAYANQESVIQARWDSVARGGGSGRRGLGTLIRAAREHGGQGLPQHTTERVADEYKAILDLAPLPSESKPADGHLAGPTEFDPGTYIANILLRDRYGDGRLLCYGSDEMFWEYNGKFWTPRAKALIEQEAYNMAVEFCKRKKAKKANTSTIMSAAVNVLRARAAVDVNLAKKEKQMSMINLKNTTVLIEDTTGEVTLQAHRPEDKLTSIINVEYDPTAKCELMRQSLTEIFDPLPDRDAVVDFIWEAIGYTIQPVKNIPAWFLLFGAGRNGKSMLLSVLGSLLGTSLVSKGMHEFENDKHSYSDLVGALAVVDDDLRANTILRDDLLKKITENKSLSANPKYKKAFDFQSTATVFMASNHWPQTRDLSSGMLRRAYVIPFLRQFNDDEVDLNRAQRIKDSELSGVLAAALDGLQRLRRRGHFAVPQSCLDAAQRWIRSSNQAAVFEDEHYVRTGEVRDVALFDDVWDQYKIWCMSAGMNRTFTRHRLIEALRSYGWKVGEGRKFIGVRAK